MLAARHKIRGRPLGSVTTEPVITNLRLLAIQVLAQALRDARGAEPLTAQAALAWLNSPSGREIAALFGCPWARRRAPVTVADLPRRVRGTYFRGGWQ